MQTLSKDIPAATKEEVAKTLIKLSHGNKENEELGQSWLLSGFIHSKEDKKTKLFELGKKSSRDLLQSLCYSEFITIGEKQQYLDKVLGKDHSDVAQELRLGCFAAIPDAKLKEEVWKEFTNPNSKLSLTAKQAQMEHFTTLEQTDLLKPYQHKYFSNML